jgi:phage prohead protease, HK97 family
MKETRIVLGEVRACMSGKGMRVSGIAARYSNPTVIAVKSANASFQEVLAPGAFRNAVAAKQDTKFLINHDVNRLMGSVAAGTLRLRESANGLEFEADLPESDDGRNAYASIKRGDMSECSFGFNCEAGDDRWDMTDVKGKRMARRTIRNIAELTDVSAVTFPAYGNTSVQARAEQRSEIVIPQEFVVVEEPETDSVEAIERRRQLLNISLL